MIRLTRLAVSRRAVVLLLAFGVFAGGLFSWGQLQQELIPNIDIPVVAVITSEPGASAADVTAQVTKPIEQAIGSVPRLDELDSTSANSLSLVVAQFSYGTDVKATRTTIEQAVQALSLPQGATPQVTSFNFSQTPILTAAVQAGPGTSQDQLAGLAGSTILPALRGIDGVASADLTGGEVPRVLISLDPTKLAADGISTQQVTSVLQANNLLVPSGQVTQGSTSIPVSTVHQFGSLQDIAGLVVGVKSPSATAAAPATSGVGTPGGGSAPGSGGTTPGATGAAVGGAGSATGGATPGAGSATGGATAGEGALPSPVTIGDLGTVQEVQVPATGYSRFDGQPSLTLTVTKTTSANTVSVADAVRAKLAQLTAQSGGHFKVTTVVDTSTYITQSRDGLLREGGLGAIFAILTIFLFLLSFRSTLVAAASIPLSILAALGAMLVAGISINILTLGGLAVAVGRVVDDAIVVLENIYRHRGRGDPMTVAVISGTREVASAITSSTLTTIAVFLPLGFVGGIVSQFFLPFALTVTFALLASLLVALTVVPVLATLFIDRVRFDPDEGPQHHETIWQRLYTPALRLALRSRVTRWGTLALAVALFIGSAALLPHIPTQFLNTGSEKSLTVTVSPPAGTPSADVLQRAIHVEDILRADPQVRHVDTTVPAETDTGFQALAAASSGGAANSATLVVVLDPSTDLAAEQVKFLDQLKPEEAGGYGIQVAQQSLGGASSALSVVVTGNDPAAVQAATHQVLQAVRSTPNLVNARSDLTTDVPTIQVAVDPNKALLAGLTTAQVAGQIRAALAPQLVTQVELGGGAPQDVYLQVAPSGVSSAATLAQLPIGTTHPVPLGAIAQIQQVSAQATVTRVNQSLAGTVSADITSQDQGAVSRAVQTKIDDLRAAGHLTGVDVRLAGVTEQTNTAFSGLFAAMATAILLVYIVMVLVFNSLVDPFVILFSLPLATIGAFIALFLTGRAIGLSALIGFLMLIGIVVTNAIVLVDLVEQLRQRGLSTHDALVEGGRTRVRPILMTAIATILALLPLGLGLNEGSIIASDLATVVIGGLFSSTFLTLIVVPVVYSLVEGGKDGVTGWRRRRQDPAPAPAAVGDASEDRPRTGE